MPNTKLPKSALTVPPAQGYEINFHWHYTNFSGSNVKNG